MQGNQLRGRESSASFAMISKSCRGPKFFVCAETCVSRAFATIALQFAWLLKIILHPQSAGRAGLSLTVEVFSID